MLILVPNTVELSLNVGDDDTVITYDTRDHFPAEARDAEVLIAWDNAAQNLKDAAQNLTSLRWVGTLAAGPDQILAAGFGPDVILTSGRGLHDATVTEHALALILATVRRLGPLADAQRSRRWDREVNREQTDPATAATYTLCGANVTIWGYGSIGARLASVLGVLGARVTGVARTPGTRDGVPVVGAHGLGDVLATTDILVSLVPATAATTRVFDADRIAQLPPHAVFINVGRGATVDEAALVNALSTARLRAAALDVTATEPLPADSPLWDARNLIITPHVAGNRPWGAERLIEENLAALRADRPLRNVIERT